METELTESPRKSSKTGVVFLVLVGILLLAGYFRFTGLNWDEGYHLHPDERFLTMVANDSTFVDSLAAYFQSSTSTLNPHNIGHHSYVYGNLPMTTTRFFAERLAGFCAERTEGICQFGYLDFSGIHIAGRFLSGFVDVISVLFTFLIGARLYGRKVGLLGALLLALAVMPIQQSHFFTTDNWAAALTTITLYFAVRASENIHKKRWWILFGVFLGLAVASRINVAPLALMAGVAAIVYVAKQAKTKAYFESAVGTIDLRRAILGIILAAAISFVVFRFAQPYAFADKALVIEEAVNTGEPVPTGIELWLKSTIGLNPKWLDNIEDIQHLQTPQAAFPPATQWVNRPAIIFPLTNMILYGMGITAGITAWLGFLWALWQIIQQKPTWQKHLIPVTWVGMYFLYIGTRWVKSVRYFLPIYPLLMLFAAWMVITLYNKAKASESNRIAKQTLAAVFAAIVVLPSLLWANAFLDIYREPVTRVKASAWMYDNVRSGMTLHYEVNGEKLQLQLPLHTYNFPPNSQHRLNFTAPRDGIVTAVTYNYLTSLTDTAEPHTFVLNLIGQNGAITGSASHTFDLSTARERIEVNPQGWLMLEGETYTLETSSVTSYSNILAETSVLANEHWDDSLPVRYNGTDPFSQYYKGISDPDRQVGGQMAITWPDDQNKKDGLMKWVDDSDYIILSSQRAVWSLPRIPLTYPLSIVYFDALFSGELGFEMIGEFHSDLHIGPLYISDTGGEISWGEPPKIGWPPANELAAEEAFSVYDHPPVWIFEKSDDYDSAKMRALLGQVDVSQMVFMNPGEATKAVNGLMLSDQAAANQRANGTYSELFALNGIWDNDLLASALWWLAIVVLGLLTFPLCYVLFRALPTRGYAFGRILVLLLIAYPAWLASSVGLLPNTRNTLMLMASLVIIVSLIVLIRNGAGIGRFLGNNGRYILTVEALGLVLFILSLYIRSRNPDVWDVFWGGEKPMDLSYFTATLKSTTFPPYDPWYAGGYLNYYYWGFVYVGSLTKILGVPPTTAYNLILPMLFSFTGMGAFSLAYNLYHKLRYAGQAIWQKRAVYAGLMAICLSVLLGNLGELNQLNISVQNASIRDRMADPTLAENVLRTGDGLLRIVSGEQNLVSNHHWFWDASRALNWNEGEASPITEFPYFTFLYGDLHAHMIALPLTLLALAWIVSLITLPREKPSMGLIGRFLIGGIIIGSLNAVNSWDSPTYLVIATIGIIYFSVRQMDEISVKSVAQGILYAIGLWAISRIAFHPFNANFGAGFTEIGLWDGSKTTMRSYIRHHGVFLFLTITFLLQQFREWTKAWQISDLEGWKSYSRIVLASAALFILIIAFLLFSGYFVAPLALILITLSTILALRRGISPTNRVILVLIACAIGLTFAVELIVIEGTVGRMNTVFKFYMPVWIILSIIGGIAFVEGWSAANARWSNGKRLIWQTSLTLLLCSAALYPLLGTVAKWDSRYSQDAPTGLDGMAFMPTTEYQEAEQTITLADDYDALKWMQENISGSPVTVEANTFNAYRTIGGRVAMFTGLPNIINWKGHQDQQRAVIPGQIRDRRVFDLNNLYASNNHEEVWKLIQKYDVGYIYIGQLERAYYGQGIDKFSQMRDRGMLQEVYSNGTVIIYRVAELDSASWGFES